MRNLVAGWKIKTGKGHLLPQRQIFLIADFADRCGRPAGFCLRQCAEIRQQARHVQQMHVACVFEQPDRFRGFGAGKYPPPVGQGLRFIIFFNLPDAWRVSLCQGRFAPDHVQIGRGDPRLHRPDRTKNVKGVLKAAPIAADGKKSIFNDADIRHGLTRQCAPVSSSLRFSSRNRRRKIFRRRGSGRISKQNTGERPASRLTRDEKP